MVFRAFVLYSLQSHLCAFGAQPYVCVKSFAQPTNGVGVLLGLKTPPNPCLQQPEGLAYWDPGLSLERARAALIKEGPRTPGQARTSWLAPPLQTLVSVEAKGKRKE